MPKMSPAKAAEIIIQFHEGLAKGLKAGGLKVTPPKNVRKRMNLGVENAGCFEGACLTTATGLTGKSRLATAKITSVGKNYTIEVRLYSGGSVVSKAQGRCDICTVAEAIAAITRVATDVGGKGEDPPKPPPVIQPTPPPAAPVQPKIKPKQKPLHRKTTVTGVKKRRGRWPLWPGIVLAATGVVGISIGAPLISIDGNGTNCVGDPKPNYGHCADLYNTATGGWVLTSMGIGALAGAGVLFYLHFTSKSKEQRRAGVEQLVVMPTSEGGMVLGASGRF